MAQNKRQLACLARRAVRMLTVTTDRQLVARQAQELEAEAAALEAQASALQGEELAKPLLGRRFT
jgi:hypothetical protein